MSERGEVHVDLAATEDLVVAAFDFSVANEIDAGSVAWELCFHEGWDGLIPKLKGIGSNGTICLLEMMAT